MTSGAAKASGVNEFADTVGRDIYIDVAGWHLVRVPHRPQSTNSVRVPTCRRARNFGAENRPSWKLTRLGLAWQYLKDCKMSVGVASALAQKVAATGGKVSETDVRDVCAKIAVPLGGGRSTLSLSDVMPERCVQDLTDITRRFANKEL